MGKYDPAPQNPRKAADKRDPCIANVDEISPESYERPGIAGTSWDLGAATGTRLLGVDVTEIPPGKKSSHFHSHSHKEEFFFVLLGRCLLRLGDKEYDLRPGDAVSRPAGTGVCHQFHNPHPEPCRVMMLGVQAGKGVEDTVEWPELGRAFTMDAEGNRKIIRR
ncbi:MAG: cupin domain-containing protein [Elusimicrobia bacterium]|nr:cupin domain-containing protein [Elusimicrobiota bacterium]